MRGLSGLLAASVLSPELGFLPARHSSSLAAASVRTPAHIWADRLLGGALGPPRCCFIGNSFLFGGGSPGPKTDVSWAPGGISGCQAPGTVIQQCSPAVVLKGLRQHATRICCSHFILDTQPSWYGCANLPGKDGTCSPGVGKEKVCSAQGNTQPVQQHLPELQFLFPLYESNKLLIS